MLDPAFDANVVRHLVNAGGIERRGQADRLGKFGRALDGNAVQRLAPPIVGGHAEARDRARMIDQLRRLFLERHPVDEVGCARFRRSEGFR